MDELREAAAAARSWLFEGVFPRWSTAGFDAGSGQFVERLSFAGEPLALPRRTLVQARQLYVFAAAGRLGWSGPWRALLQQAGEALLARGRGAEGDWCFDFGPDGGPRDQRCDLYTQAFVMFGLAHAGQALGRAEFVDAAAATAERLEAWRHPAGGYREAGADRRRQNPHMHLLEAFLALHVASGAAEPLSRAAELAELFRGRFLDPRSGALLEYFDDDWRPLEDLVEPGHEFEWVWLLDRLRRAGGPDLEAECDRLFRHGEGLGVADNGLAFDEIAVDGRPLRRSHRLWPQTERLKAGLARWRRRGDAADLATALAAWGAMQVYFEGLPPGAWRDRAFTDGGWEEGGAPASSGYHVVCALEELIAAAETGPDAGFPPAAGVV